MKIANPKKFANRMIWLVCIVGLITTLIILAQKWHTTSHFPRSLRTPQSAIQDLVKLTVTPQLPNSSQKMSIDITAETTQYPDFLDGDFTKLAYIQLPNGQMITPASWKELLKDQYKKKGVLYFKLPKPLPKQFDLVVYVMDPVTFHWPAHNTR